MPREPASRKVLREAFEAGERLVATLTKPKVLEAIANGPDAALTVAQLTALAGSVQVGRAALEAGMFDNSPHATESVLNELRGLMTAAEQLSASLDGMKA